MKAVSALLQDLEDGEGGFAAEDGTWNARPAFDNGSDADVSGKEKAEGAKEMF